METDQKGLIDWFCERSHVKDSFRRAGNRLPSLPGLILFEFVIPKNAVIKIQVIDP